jgi:hypothetical protein
MPETVVMEGTGGMRHGHLPNRRGAPALRPAATGLLAPARRPVTTTLTEGSRKPRPGHAQIADYV